MPAKPKNTRKAKPAAKSASKRAKAASPKPASSPKAAKEAAPVVRRSSAELHFTETTILRGEAVEPGEQLPSGATHEIAGHDELAVPAIGNPDLEVDERSRSRRHAGVHATAGRRR